MKILINKDDKPFRVYNHPREVIVHPKTNRVEIFNSDGSVLETYDLVKKEVRWIEDVELDTAEVLVTLYVK